MKFVFSFFTRLNKKKHTLSVLVSLFLVVGATTVYAQAKIIPKGQVDDGRAEHSATRDISESTKNYFKTGGTDLGQWVGGSANVQLVQQNGQTTPGSPGVWNIIEQTLLRDLIGSPREEITLASGERAYIGSAGAIQTTTGMMAKVYTNTPSSSEYIADLMEDIRNPFGAQPAYAQGLGFSSLRPVLEMWKVFRNLAYFFFVIIFLFIGFLIMFRSKIGGQAAVTVQQALPKIVISLILVTFSYAIAGLMLDLMYLSIYLIIGILSTSAFFPNGIVPGPTPMSLVDIAFRNNIITNMFGLISSSVGNVASAVGEITLNSLNINNDLLRGVVQGTSNVVVYLVLAAFILISIFRVFFALLQAYVGIFFSVIFAPLQLLLGALPGNNNAFRSWIMELTNNLVVFPTIILMLLLAHYFSNTTIQQNQANTGTIQQIADSLPSSDFASQANAQGFSAPQLGSNQEGGQTAYLALISLAIIGSLPDVIKISRGLLKGQVDIDPGHVFSGIKKGANQFTGTALPLASGIAGAGVGVAIGGIGGLGTKQAFNIGNLWGGYVDPTTKQRVGGLRRGFGSGWSKGQGAARAVDNALELKFADPNNVTRLLEQANKNADLAEQRKKISEQASAAAKNRRGPA